MHRKIIYIFIAAAFSVLLVAFVSGKKTKTDFEMARELIVMRNIAHRVLLYSGDSSSVVLPVKQLSTSEFRIPFATGFSFKPDSLVSMIDKIIGSSGLPAAYIVNVAESGTSKVVFGYAMSGRQLDNIVPCIGRDQPVKQYFINIKFPEPEPFPAKTLYITGAGLLAIGLALAGLKKAKQHKALPATQHSNETVIEKNAVAISQYRFYPKEQSLVFGDEKIQLTIKESQLLGLFAAAPNEVLDRNQLQKLWEDEGVIVGRSLDMFVSRLRKKLERDAAVKIANIHGKGYRLEVGSVIADVN